MDRKQLEKKYYDRMKNIIGENLKDKGFAEMLIILDQTIRAAKDIKTLGREINKTFEGLFDKLLAKQSDIKDVSHMRTDGYIDHYKPIGFINTKFGDINTPVKIEVTGEGEVPGGFIPEFRAKTKKHPTSYCCDSKLIKICKERMKNDASESISLEELMDQEGITEKDLKNIDVELNEIKDTHELIKDRKNSKTVELSFDELKGIVEDTPKTQSTEQILWGLIGDKCHPNNVLSVQRYSQYCGKYKIEVVNDSIGIIGDLQTEIHDENGNVNIDTYIADTINKTIHKVAYK